MPNISREVWIYAHWEGLSDPLPLGLLVEHGGKSQNYTFQWEQSVLQDPYYRPLRIDPYLPLAQGIHHPNPRQSPFGFLLDSAPDRWGRSLIQHRWASQQKAGAPNDLDYLLAVHDHTRSGALRFLTPETRQFQADADKPIPPLYDLEELNAACAAFASSPFGAAKDKRTRELLDTLFDRGSSLGGARPKATIMDSKGQLFIAKFAHPNDNYDKSRWEYLCQILATRAGLKTSYSDYKPLKGNHGVYLIKRFDRTPTGERLHYASAKTLTGLPFGADRDQGPSYLHIAQAIVANSNDPKTNLHEMWSRIVFSLAVSNNDDQLRNHGFLLQPDLTWSLSPLFDVNPVPNAPRLKLLVDDQSAEINFAAARRVAQYFQLSREQAEERLQEITRVVAQWRVIADALHIPKAEQQHMSPAFRLATDLHPLLPKKLSKRAQKRGNSPETKP